MTACQSGRRDSGGNLRRLAHATDALALLATRAGNSGEGTATIVGLIGAHGAIHVLVRSAHRHGAVLDPTDLIWHIVHLPNEAGLLLVQLRLVDAGLRVQPVLVDVAFAVKLLVDVRCLQQVTFHKAVAEAATHPNRLTLAHTCNLLAAVSRIRPSNRKEVVLVNDVRWLALSLSKAGGEHAGSPVSTERRRHDGALQRLGETLIELSHIRSLVDILSQLIVVVSDSNRSSNWLRVHS